MKNFKRILALVLTFTFVLSMAIVGVSASYQGKWYAAAVDYLDSLSISDIGAFGDEPLSRDEFVTWVAKLESHQIIESAWESMEFVALMRFSDVADSDHKGAISYSVGREFIEGNGDGTFTPHNTVTFGEACAVIVRLMAYTSLVEGSTWDEKVHNYQYVANTFCGAIDDVFLAESQIYDPDYKLSKGEGAYLLYSIMNGAYWTGADEDAERNFTSFDVDLGEYFGTAGAAKVKGQYLVASAPLKYENTTQVYRRYEAYVTGATYDELYDDSKLYRSKGDLDLDSVVTLINTFTGEYLFVDADVFAELVLANDPEAADALEVVEAGSVVTLTFKRSALDNAGDYLESTEGVTLTLNASKAADTYVGRESGTQVVGWRVASKAAANSEAAKRITDTKVYWDGDTLVVDGDEYTVVTDYTGVAGELKVFAPEGVMEATTKSLVSVIGYKGDVVPKGAYFEDGQKEVLLAHGDYASKFSGNTVATEFALTSDIPSFVAYTLDVTGMFVTNTSFGIVSDFVQDGYFGTVIDTEYALTVEEAKSVILEPAQGESNVVFSDTDRDGFYDIAVVTQSSRAVYYAGANSGPIDDLGSQQIGGIANNYTLNANATREVYDAFGNYLFSTVSLKGNNIGGIVVDMTVKTQRGLAGGATANSGPDANTFAGGTDNWYLDSTTPTGKVQVVLCISDEREIKGGNSDKTGYVVENVDPYYIVDVATLLTGYVYTCSDATVDVDGVACYRYIIKNADPTAAGEEFSVVYVPAVAPKLVDVDVTVDGVTSTVTFAAGEDLLSAYVNAPAKKLVGHTVKYVADENGVVWCAIDTAESGKVTGYVTGTGTTKDIGIYNVTLATSALASTSTTNLAVTAQAVASRLKSSRYEATFVDSFGIDALTAGEGEKDVKVWRFTEAGEMYLLAKGAVQGTQPTYNFASEEAAMAFVAKYGLFRAATYEITAADGSFVAAPASMFAAAEDFVTTGGYDYFVVDAAEVEAERVFDGNAWYYTKNADNGFNYAEGITEFDPDTTYYTIEVAQVVLDWTQQPEPDPDTTYYTGTDIAWAVADVTGGFDQQVDYFTIVATEVEAELVFDPQETYYTTDGTHYYVADIQAFEVGVTYYTIEADVADGDFDADEDYFVLVDGNYLKVAADQFTEESDSYYVLEGEDYVQNDLPIAIEGVDYFVPDTAGTLSVTRKNFNSLFMHGVSGDAPLIGLYYPEIPATAEAKPYFKTTHQESGAFGNLFVAGTLISYSDGRYFIKDEYTGFVDVTEYVDEDNFELWGDLYVDEDGDYVVADQYDEDATYYAVFFEETVYDAFELFGYINWGAVQGTALVDYKTENYKANGVETFKVKADLVSSWTFSADDAAIVTDILENGLNYNAANFAKNTQGTFTAADLLYVSLALDSDGYYVIEGVDADSYAANKVIGDTFMNICFNYPTGTYLKSAIFAADTYDDIKGNYRVLAYMGFRYDVKAAGAATTWVVGDANWANDYKFDYVRVNKIADIHKDPNDQTSQVTGEVWNCNMTVGTDPYYEKTVDANGKVTYAVKWGSLTKWINVEGTFKYDFDPNKAVLIPLYVDGGQTQLLNSESTKDYSQDDSYYVSSDDRVWKIDDASPSAYDTDLSKAKATYNFANAEASQDAVTSVSTPVSELPTIVVTKDGDAYKLSILKGIDAYNTYNVDADADIVIVTPTNTDVVTITVTTPEKLYEAGQTVFAASYQSWISSGKCTMLSVIGTTSGNASAVAIPTESETPVAPVEDPDDPTAEVRVCYVTAEGLALDFGTGSVFTAVKNAPAAGYYKVAKNGAVKGAIEILNGELTSVNIASGAPVGLDGEYAFVRGADIVDETPWGVPYSTTYLELYIQRTLYQNANATVTFQYFVDNDVTYVLVDSIEIG